MLFMGTQLSLPYTLSVRFALCFELELTGKSPLQTGI